MGSRTLAELIAMQALSRRFLDTSEGRRAVDMIQQILQIASTFSSWPARQ
jgi:hypothetical protein